MHVLCTNRVIYCIIIHFLFIIELFICMSIQCLSCVYIVFI
nr:MAG TPA: hypothetical protein [Caudoviricetes sp.]